MNYELTDNIEQHLSLTSLIKDSRSPKNFKNSSETIMYTLFNIGEVK